MPYKDIIFELPLPSTRQMENFADYVSKAHSWYKHLPLHPYSRFNFFLDPNAGRQMVHKKDGSIVFIDITDESQVSHYSTKNTTEYREKFGYLNYHTGRGTTFQFSTKEGILDTSTVTDSGMIKSEGKPESHITIFDSRHGWVYIPREILSRGECSINCLIQSPSRHMSVLIPDTNGIKKIKGPEIFDLEFDRISLEVLKALKGLYPFIDLEFNPKKVNASHIEVLKKEKQRQFALMVTAMENFVQNVFLKNL